MPRDIAEPYRAARRYAAMAMTMVTICAGLTAAAAPSHAQGQDDAVLCMAGTGTADIDILVCSRALDVAGRRASEAAGLLSQRGHAHLRRRRTDAALTDFNAAIRRNPASAVAYDGRGLAHVQRGDAARARADFDAALRLFPHYATAYRHRGTLHFFSGRLPAAIADYDRALRLNAHQPEVMIRRAVTKFLGGDNRGAREDFVRAAGYSYAYPYGALWRAAAAHRLGEDGTAVLRQAAGELDAEEWPMPLLALYLGAGDETAVQERIARMPARLRARLTADADFYIGLHHMMQGKDDKAAAAFRRTIAANLTQSVERVAAARELARLE